MNDSIKRRGVCLIISAPSGAGKSTIANALRASESRLMHSVSVTTRLPRPGEKEGVHYHFRDRKAYDEMIAQGDLLEWAEVFGHGYGTPRRPVEEALADGYDMVFDIDWQGHRLMRAALPDDVVSIFILPPSIEELERRLRGRQSDSNETIENRMRAAQNELSHWAEFDHNIVNDDLDHAIRQTKAVLRAARLRTARQVGLNAFTKRFFPS
ncbi:guanylate kinase [Candidatus Kirkpatrickella diaphorinae]|uniref:Guanylate kinase n=1 Tax=Candidatus Kirkpatrickella diaphorinae TaxID=2984322 RepID=A0ABY6GIK3_9PROT|nr:guanylate kinase [Candidatus Kirkpatrickella diaphorinae]UYH51089.1 guanylate kinase [Candidatus Kirkpatrickella diaphorinae]